MSNFIRVIGKDPFYPSLDIQMFISLDSIQKIFPIYGLKGKNNIYEQCTPIDQDAQFLAYGILDFKGHTYTCNDPEELKKIGIENKGKNPEITFLKTNKEKLGIEQNLLSNK